MRRIALRWQPAHIAYYEDRYGSASKRDSYGLAVAGPIPLEERTLDAIPTAIDWSYSGMYS